MKGRTKISDNQNVEIEAFKVGVYTPENRGNIKVQAGNETYRDKSLTRSAESFKSKRRLKFKNPSTGSGEISACRRDLFHVCSQRKTQKTGEILPYNDR